MLCEDGFEGTQATDGLNVSHDTHHNDRRSLNDGDRLYFLSFCLLCGRNMEDILCAEMFLPASMQWSSIKHLILAVDMRVI